MNVAVKVAKMVIRVNHGHLRTKRSFRSLQPLGALSLNLFKFSLGLFQNWMPVPKSFFLSANKVTAMLPQTKRKKIDTFCSISPIIDRPFVFFLGQWLTILTPTQKNKNSSLNLSNAISPALLLIG